MKRGRNLQAEALIEIMLKKGLIERIFDHDGDTFFAITPKGRAYSRLLEEARS